MQIRQLEHFEAVYRLGGFGQAAAEQYLTQSALSRSIRSLEDALGQRLFDRTTHVVEPTDAAHDLLPYALDVLTAVGALREEATRLRGGSGGMVRFGTGPYPAQPLATRVVRRLSAEHAGIQVRVAAGTTRDLLSALVSRELDFVVCDMSKFADMPGGGEVEIVPLPSEPLVVAARGDHPVLRSNPTAEDLAACPWALPTPAPSALRALPGPFADAADAGRLPFYRLETTSACLEIVQDGRTLTLVPLSLARATCDANGLGFRLAGPAQQTNDGVHFVRNRSRSASVQLAVAAVEAEAAAIAAESSDWAEGRDRWRG